jgi:hypothetical protein
MTRCEKVSGVFGSLGAAETSGRRDRASVDHFILNEITLVVG